MKVCACVVGVVVNMCSVTFSVHQAATFMTVKCSQCGSAKESVFFTEVLDLKL